MNEIIQVASVISYEKKKLTYHPIFSIQKCINNITSIIPALCNRNKITPNNVKNNDSSVEISNDMTTYIRCLFHDFRGPLNNISLGVDVLLESIDNYSDNFGVLQNIKESCSFLSELLDGFISMGNINITENKLDEIKFEPFNIIGLIKKIQYILLFNSMGKKINIKYNIKPLEEWVIGDYKKIQHVLLNLITNAIKYSSEGGNIILQLERIKNKKDKKQHIVISIIDENGFISQKIKERIFEKSNKLDNINGKGLRLYTCKNIIEMQGGNMYHLNNNDLTGFVGNASFSKNLKKGNIFQIELFLDICPSSETELNNIVSRNIVSKSDESNKIDKYEGKEKDGRFDMGKYVDIDHSVIEDESVNLKNNNSELLLKRPRSSSVQNLFSESKSKDLVNIMVIDDSEISRKMLVRLLDINCKKVKIIDAIDGLDALIKIVRFKEEYKNKISMILLDNVMPNLTGEILSKILRGIGYDGLIIGITGNGVEEDKDKFLENGADYVFVKPFNKEKLVMLLELIKGSGYYSKNPLRVIEENGKLYWKD